MRLLLDSHAFIWYVEDDPNLSEAAKTAMVDPQNSVWISAATIWEISLKVKVGKLKLKLPFETLFPGKLEALGFQFLPIEIAHIRETLSLPFHHNDPFDRLLIAQVKVEGMSFVSRDENCPAYGIPLIW